MKNLTPIVKLGEPLCLFIRMRGDEIGNKESTFNFMATSGELKEQETVNFMETKMKNDPTFTFK